MKNRRIAFFVTLASVGAFAACLLAQSPAHSISDAMALLQEGKIQQAQEFVSAIAEGDPEYPAAQCCKALCLYAAKDTLGFLKAMKSPVIERAAIAPEMRDDLNYEHIDALYQYRRFEDVLAKIQEFQKQSTNAARLQAVREYQLSALFERGMKKTQEACLSKDEAFQKRWSEGKANLEEFLKVAEAFRGTNYNVVQYHNLTQDKWTARLTLGDEQAALAEAANADAATREKVNLLRVQLYTKLQPEKTEQNIAKLNAFLSEFPDTHARRWVEFQLVGLNFSCGKVLNKEADEIETKGETKTAAAKRSAASKYFEIQRALFPNITVDKEAGIEESDLRDLREDLIYGYLWEKDYTAAARITADLVARSKPGEPDWVMGRLWQGIELRNRDPQNLADAAKIFDELLALGFNGDPVRDKMLILAAKWRVNVAMRSHDLEKAREVVRSVRDGNCTKNIKDAFMKVHIRVLGPAGI